MNRDYRFDIARVVSMTYIVAFMHLYGYIYDVKSAYFIPECAVLTDACLGLFTFVSGYLLGRKYVFGKSWRDIWQFYKKRLLRIIPLFLLSAIVLYLIGFNSARATLNGILCISPFIKPRPMTLWYIPVILLCYLITPIVCRKNFTWRLVSSLAILFILIGLKKVIPTIDWRFQYNMLFYLVGLVSSPYFDWKFKKASFVKWLIVALFVGLIVITHFYKPNVHIRHLFAGIGVIAVLFVCEGLANVVFRKDNLVSRTVTIVSYASMACYMFHRLFFWLGELAWNPLSHGLKWIYMAGVIFPAMLVFSYFIQKGYDIIIERLTKKEIIYGRNKNNS